MIAADLLRRRAELTPEREALLDLSSGIRYSFGELNNRTNRAANLLREKFGLESGDRVSILAQNCVEYLDLFYGLSKIGVIFAPLNWRLAVQELEYIVNDCRPRAIIFGPEFAGTLDKLSKKIDVEYLMSLGDAEVPGAFSYDKELAAATHGEPKSAATDPDGAQCILYTSGTTGKPKGAVIPHRQVLWNCINTAVSWGLSERDVSPVFTPLFHAGGLFAFLTPLFYLGGRIVLAQSFDVSESLQIIINEKCSVILGVPTIFQMWLESPEYASADFSNVRFFISGGAPCPPSLMQTWRDQKRIVFRQGYGLTEVGPNCFTMTDEDSVRKSGAVGKPIFHSQMKLVDEAGNEVPAGQTGELAIKGSHVCAGYWQNQEATAAAIKDGWFYTGDMARRDEEGFYTIAGRFKDMIISGGENIYAAEVEAVFMEHSTVAEAALIGKPDVKWGEIGVMICVMEKGKSATKQQLNDFCIKRVARYKVPKVIIFADSLPYSPYGKVIKSDLRDRYLK